MNILFVFFTLPHLSQSSMYSDLVNEFKGNGHNVFPMAPAISAVEHSQISTENEIEVLRVKTLDGFSKNKYKKGFANLLFSYQYKKGYNQFWQNTTIDLIIVATPSVMFANFVHFIKKRKHAKVYLMQKDIFPQNAVDLGLMKKGSLLYYFFKRHEIHLLKIADIIGATSPGNIRYLRENYNFITENKIQLLFNSSKLIRLEPDKSELEVYNLQDKFIVVFGGNMGKPQQLENVIQLASNCSIYPEVVFLIIGKGTEVEKLKNNVKNQHLTNLKFLQNLPRVDYFKLISNCNIGLISLHKNFTVPNTPMKLNDYLNAGIPILASIDKQTDLGEILVDNKMGLFAYADSPEDLFLQFKKLYFNPELCKELGRNGKQFCFAHLSTEFTYAQIMDGVEKL